MEVVTAESVREAQERIGVRVVRTPVVFSPELSRRGGGRVYLKLENLQVTGAFKFRGALNAVTRLDREARRAGVVTASSGNHGLGLALAGQLLGVAVTVVMPVVAPAVKVRRAGELGARVIRAGGLYDEASAAAREIARRAGSILIPSFDHPDIIAGQGTIGLELREQVPDADLWVAPVGGGGLLAGLALAAGGDGPAVVGVQAEGAASMVSSLRAGEPVRLPRVRTLADGIAVAQPGRLTFSIAAERGLAVVTVADKDLVRAVGELLVEAKVVTEPAGAAGAAALRRGVVAAAERTAVVVITGGNAAPSFLRRALAARSPRAGTG